MQRTASLVAYLYKHHFIRYLVVGFSTVAIDLGLLFVLHGKASVHLAIATSIAYWVSIVYNFLLNRSWTFSASDKRDLKRHLTSYLILLGFNYVFTVVFVDIVSHHINYLLAKMLAVAIQMSWTYLAYKNLIFHHKSQPSDLL